MSIEPTEFLETGASALLFAAAFLWGDRVHPLRRLIRDPGSIASFGAGMSVAYVFIYLMPELNGARHAFTISASRQLPFHGMSVYFLALVGFLVFYGLGRLRSQLHEAPGTGKLGLEFKLHIGGFAAYVCLMSYLLVDNLEETPVSTLFYAAAIAFHFLAVDHSLREEHGDAYRRIGRFVLAGACLIGWGIGVLYALPRPVLALLEAFISGAIIMNSTIMELPTDENASLWPFVAGGLVYGLILLPLA